MSNLPSNVPDGAITINYFYGDQKGQYYIWVVIRYSSLKPYPMNRWHWHALGNSGEEATRELAEEKARQWITNNRIK